MVGTLHLPGGGVPLPGLDTGASLDALETVKTLSTTPQQVLGNDPRAISLLVQNIGTTSIYLGLSPQVSAVLGMTLDVGADPLILSLGGMPWVATRAWYAVAASGTPSLYLLRVVTSGQTR